MNELLSYILVALIVGLGSATFGVVLADRYIVGRRTKKTIKLVKNEFMHSKQGQQIMSMVEGFMSWREKHGDEAVRDVETIMKFIHDWAEHLREKDLRRKGQVKSDNHGAN